MKWRPSLFESIDLCGASTTWEAFCKIVQNCDRLKVLNMAKMKATLSECPIIQAVNIVELTLSEIIDNDRRSLSFISVKEHPN